MTPVGVWIFFGAVLLVEAISAVVFVPIAIALGSLVGGFAVGIGLRAIRARRSGA